MYELKTYSDRPTHLSGKYKMNGFSPYVEETIKKMIQSPTMHISACPAYIVDEKEEIPVFPIEILSEEGLEKKKKEVKKEVNKDVEELVKLTLKLSRHPEKELADDLSVIEACEKFKNMGYFKKKRMIDVSQIMK